MATWRLPILGVTMDDVEDENLMDANTFREKMWRAFEYPHSSLAAFVIYYLSGFFIAASVITNLIETISCGRSQKTGKTISCGIKYAHQFFIMDTACVMLFTFEYMLRLYASNNRIRFMKSVMSVIDVIAIMPYYIGIIMSTRGEGLRILGYTLKSCASELGFLLFSMALVIVIFATMIYYTEKNEDETTFISIPASAWYTIVTLTTLGYGDMVPKSWLGKMLGGLCALSGVLVIALPVPVIVSNFNRIFNQSQRSDKARAQKTAQQQHLSMAKNAIAQSYIKYRESMRDQANSLSHTLDKLNISQQQHFYLLHCLETVTGRDFVNSETTRSNQHLNVNKHDYTQPMPPSENAQSDNSVVINVPGSNAPRKCISSKLYSCCCCCQRDGIDSSDVIRMIGNSVRPLDEVTSAFVDDKTAKSSEMAISAEMYTADKFDSV